MPALLHQPFLKMIGADPSTPEVSPASEILIARVSALLYTLVNRAPETAVVHAAASGSNAALMHAVADLLITEAPADDAWTTVRLHGSVALAECLEASGGVWTADEATARLDVKRQTLQQWRDKGHVLALQRHDGSYSYPVAQFAPPASDLGVPRPYPAIAQITAMAESRLSTEELVAMLATPQPLLRDANGAPMTPFVALAHGEVPRVLDLVRYVVTPPDADAPDVDTEAPTVTFA